MFPIGKGTPPPTTNTASLRDNPQNQNRLPETAAPGAQQTPTVGALAGLARNFFGKTTGVSENIAKVHGELGHLEQAPASYENVQELVNRENEAALRGPLNSTADKIARAATPLRGMAAHTAVFNVHVGRGQLVQEATTSKLGYGEEARLLLHGDGPGGTN